MWPGLFLPLVAISERLFEQASGKSVAFSAGTELDVPEELTGIPASMPLPPVAPQSLMPTYAEKYAHMPQPRRSIYLHTVYPDWPADIVARMRLAAPALLQEGRMVWAAVVLANGALFDGSADAAPAEIVYDPRGMVETEALNNAAGALSSLPDNAQASPALQAYATHLRNPSVPLLDWQTPPELTPYPLSTCTLVISTVALPGRRIAMQNFPVLVSDRHPGLAMVAPQELWPAALLKQWLDELPPEVRRQAAAWLAAGLPGPAPASRVAAAPPDAAPTADRVAMLMAAATQERIAKRRSAGRLVLAFVSACLSLLAVWTMWGNGYFD